MPALTLPYYNTFTDWADCVCNDLPDIKIEVAPDEQNWFQWAEAFVRTINEQGDYFIPQPAGFKTWQEWAERVCESMS